MQSKIQQFHDALMLDLIQAEAMQGRLYTTEELSKNLLECKRTNTTGRKVWRGGTCKSRLHCGVTHRRWSW